MATDVLERERDQYRKATQAPSKVAAAVTAPAAVVRKAPPASAAPAAVLPLDPARTRALTIVMHGKRADEPGLRAAIKELKEEGHQIAVRCTFDAGDADAFVVESLRLHDFGGTHAHTIVAAGGDGTVNEVVCALLKHGAPRGVALAVLPLGTANDFASALGISMDPAVALRVALDPSAPRLVDVGLVNGHPFINVALAGGVSAVPQEELSSPLKRALGPLGIAIHVLKRLLFKGMPPTPGVTIRFPKTAGATLAETSQHETIEGDLLVLAAGQCRQMGRALSICPDALLDDGLLDFTLVMGRLSERAAELVTDAKDRGLHGASGGVRQVAAPWLEVTAPRGTLVPVNRDGEPEEAAERLLFEVLPKRLMVHMPDDRLLVSRPKDGSNIQDAEAAAGISGGASGARRAPGTRRPATAGKVRRAVLRRMMAAVQPEGREMRLRAGLRAAAARAASAGALFALGFAAGLWARRGGAGRGGSRSRREAPAPPRAPAVAGGSHRGRRAARAGGVAVPAVPAGPLQQVVSWAGLAA